jgi:hypothetical protein
MEIMGTNSGNDSSLKSNGPKVRWGWLILLILIPIPFGPWWVTVISLATAIILAWLTFRPNKKLPTEANQIPKYPTTEI